jgi:hypothetical protein
MEEGPSKSVPSASSIYICLLDERQLELLHVQMEQEDHERATLLGLYCLATADCAMILSWDQ